MREESVLVPAKTRVFIDEIAGAIKAGWGKRT